MIEWLVIAFIPVEIAIGFTVVSLLLNNAWMPIQRAFPEQPALQPNYRRNFQSLSFGLINAGFCYHVILDDNCLHLIPVRPLRWVGQRAASIPWNAIEFHKKQPFGKRFARVVIAKQEVVAPAWCFEMLKAQHAELTQAEIMD